MRRARLLLALAGATLVVTLFIGVGPGVITASFAELSWRLLVIVCFPFMLITVLDTLGWRFAFPRAPVPFRALLLARLAGEAVNATTPTASIGGEGVKAWLLRSRIPLDESVSSVTVAKTTITIAQALFLLVGIAVAWPPGPEVSALVHLMTWLLLVEVGAVGGFVLVQTVGGARRLGRLLSRLGVLRDGTWTDELTRMDHLLMRFYRRHPGRLLGSITCHFLGWAAGALEVYMVVRFLGGDISLTTALVIEAFGTGVRFASFMVPAHLGALEGGHVATFAALGLGAPLGLAFSLVRRVRELAWTALGLVVLMALGAPRPVPSLAPPSREP